ncbi:MAG: alpha/beta fold hydrolase [Acidobacteria bacterium]|nr:alpha/beta fold hydrolase [Acidobacteriota bacterium]
MSFEQQNILYATILLTAGLMSLTTTSAHAQQTSGAYTMYVGSNAISTETYTLVSEPEGGLRAEAEITISGRKQKTTTVAAKNRPVSFLAQSGDSTLISAAFDGSGVKLQIAGQSERQSSTKATVILENAVWHHFIFLFNQYDAEKGGAQNFSGFLPSQATDFDVKVERTATPAFEVEGKPAATERYRLVAGAVVIDVWTDHSRKPLLIVIEAQGVKVVHQGAELLADAILRPATAENSPGEEVAFQNGDVSLAGTLTIPKGGGKRFPAALIISGSGSQDRDGNPGALSFYKLIAEKLSAAGVAVLRHDDRGAGRSAMPKTPTTYRDLINDSKAAVQYLRSRSEIDPDRIVLVGHSEGGTTATIIAAEDPKIAAITLLAGAILANFEQLLLEQTIYQQALERPINPQDREKFPQIVRWLIARIAEAKAGRPDASPTDLREYLRQHLALDRAETFKQIRCPVLILQGERDALVLAHHAVAAAQALADAGNKQVTLRIFPNLSHIFTPASLDPGVAAEKKNEISPEVLETIQKWIAESVKREMTEQTK